MPASLPPLAPLLDVLAPLLDVLAPLLDVLAPLLDALAPLLDVLAPPLDALAPLLVPLEPSFGLELPSLLHAPTAPPKTTAMHAPITATLARGLMVKRSVPDKRTPR